MGRRTYREVVESGEEEDNTNHGDDAEEYTAHRRLSPGTRIDFTPSVTSKSRQSTKARTNKIRDSKSNEFAIGT